MNCFKILLLSFFLFSQAYSQWVSVSPPDILGGVTSISFVTSENGWALCSPGNGTHMF